jgi:hypothetical protein
MLGPCNIALQSFCVILGLRFDTETNETPAIVINCVVLPETKEWLSGSHPLQ